MRLESATTTDAVATLVSAEALMWAKHTKVGDATRKAILLVLADYADSNASCFPGQATIAGQAETSERTVRRVLADFEERGVIRREHRHRGQLGRTSDRIFLNLTFGEVQLALDGIEPPDTLAGGQSVQRSDETDLPDTGDRPTGQSLAGEPQEEPPEEPQDRALGFEQFWSVYPARNGHKVGKQKALDKWRRMTLADKRLAYRAAVSYASAVAADRTIAKDAERFLANNWWSDWLEPVAATPVAPPPVPPEPEDCDACENARWIDSPTEPGRLIRCPACASKREPSLV